MNCLLGLVGILGFVGVNSGLRLRTIARRKRRKKVRRQNTEGDFVWNSRFWAILGVFYGVLDDANSNRLICKDFESFHKFVILIDFGLLRIGPTSCLHHICTLRISISRNDFLIDFGGLPRGPRSCLYHIYNLRISIYQSDLISDPVDRFLRNHFSRGL